MAYGTIYQATVYPFSKSNPVTFQIKKLNYAGGSSTITIKSGPILTYDTNEYFDSIVASSLEVEIVNNRSNFFEFDALFSTSDFEYQVVMYDATTKYFEGFIPCDIVEQSYLKNGTVIVNASNNLKRLTEIKPTLFTAKGGYTLISIIKDCLNKTGLTLPIYVNSSLYEVGMEMDLNPLFIGTPTVYTVFDGAYVNCDLFLEDDVVYQDCFSILDKILTTFLAKLYYWNGAWYIERVKDLGKSTKSFIVYNVNGTVGTSSQSNTSLALPTTVKYMGQSQAISYIPGKKQIKIELEENIKLNLLGYNYDLATQTGTTIELINPNYLQWLREAHLTTFTPFTNKNKIAKGLRMIETNTSGLGTALFNHVGKIWETVISITEEERVDMIRYSLCGLFTKFKFDLNKDPELADGESTTLTISMNFTLPQEFLDAETDFKANFYKTPEKYIFFFRFFLKFGSGTYIIYNKELNKYTIRARNADPDDNIIIGWVGEPGGPGGGATETYVAPAIIEHPISFADFTSRRTFSTNVSIDINVDDFREYINTNDFILGIGEIGYNLPSLNINEEEGKDLCNVTLKYYEIGDIIATINYSKQDNIYIGTISNSYLDVDESKLSLYDVNNNNILNGMFRDSILTDKTVGWGDDPNFEDSLGGTSGIPPNSIMNVVIKDRFQLFNKVRRKITTSLIYRAGILRPFKLLQDAHFTNKFYLSSFKWHVDSDQYSSCELVEYVSNDNVT